MREVCRVLAPGRLPESGVPFRAPHSSSERRRTVLVVDDDAGVREALHLILDAEYNVLDAAHGRAALRIVTAAQVDLVLLDILLPEIDGLEILQELRTIDPTLAVIMVTAVKTVRTSVAAMKLGASDYVTKPFHEEELLAAIRNALGGHALAPCAHELAARPTRTAPPARAHRLLVIGGDPGWRAALAVALERVTTVETTTTLVEGLNRAFVFRPTCVVANLGESAVATVKLVGALQAQAPAAPVFIIAGGSCLAPPMLETLNIRGIMPLPVDLGELIGRIGGVLAPDGVVERPWPRFGTSVSRTVGYMSDHFGRHLAVTTVADSIGISPSHLAHRFRSETGMTIRDYLARIRVAVAADLLTHTDEKLEAIASRVGFVDTSHMARVFRKITGSPPAAHRRRRADGGGWSESTAQEPGR